MLSCVPRAPGPGGSRHVPLPSAPVPLAKAASSVSIITGQAATDLRSGLRLSCSCSPGCTKRTESELADRAGADCTCHCVAIIIVQIHQQAAAASSFIRAYRIFVLLLAAAPCLRRAGLSPLLSSLSRSLSNLHPPARPSLSHLSSDSSPLLFTGRTPLPLATSHYISLV